MDQPREIIPTPSKETLERFRPKATEIFLNLPARQMTPSNEVRSDVHIWFREMPFPPYPVLVFMINPPSEYMYGPFHIQEELEYTPYSRESFERIRQFANYIQQQLRDDHSTKVQLVNHDYKFEKAGGRSKKLVSLLYKKEQELVEIMRSVIKWNDSELLAPAAHAATAFENRSDDLTVEALKSRLEELKTEGNGFFNRGRFHAAQSCYSEGIELVRASMNTSNSVFSLLGTLLSNRAMCFLRMAESMNPSSAAETLKRAETDCEIALKSPWAGAIPSQVREKLQLRKADARKKIDLIASRSRRDMEVLVPQVSGHNLQNETQRQRQQHEGHQANRPVALVNDSHDRDEKDGSVVDVLNVCVGGELLETGLALNAVVGGDACPVCYDRFRVELQSTHVTGLALNAVVGGDACPVCYDRFRVELQSTHVTGLALNAVVGGDACPVCYDRFRVELQSTHVVVLACRHAACVQCLWKLQKFLHKKSRSSTDVELPCPMCRVSVADGLFPDIEKAISTQTPSVVDRAACLPLTETEKTQVVAQLLHQHDFHVDIVLEQLDNFLMDNLHSEIRLQKDLTAEDKNTIYEEARRPVNALQKERIELRSMLKSFRDQESEEYKELNKRLTDLVTSLIPAAQQNARDEVFNRMNVAGSMARENASGDLVVDFHGLHVKEALERFDDTVFPILPAVGCVHVIVGRGKHSDNGVARL
ncbi:hypothetical protein ACA910_006693 [Epithemia clementina (nom. ined.)]